MSVIKKISWYELNQLGRSIEEVLGYSSDNSCSDPDCCGGPFYDIQDYVDGVELLRDYGIELDESTINE